MKLDETKNETKNKTKKFSVKVLEKKTLSRFFLTLMKVSFISLTFATLLSKGTDDM